MNGCVSILNSIVKESHCPKKVSKRMVTHSKSQNRKSANSKLRLKRHIKGN